MNYYNENDRKAAAWLRELIHAKLIPDGVVDERSIVDVKPDDLRGFGQCHFFAGISGWSYALQLAGWPSGRPVWTGSCPCQPFSSAGKMRGKNDARHLWPEFYRLIRECRPGTVFGEQVASPLGLEWIDGVRADVEAENYAFGACDLPAAGSGAPHIRQRLFWVANSVLNRRGSWLNKQACSSEGDAQPLKRSEDGGQADSEGAGLPQGGKRTVFSESGSCSGVVQPDCAGRNEGELATTAAGHGYSTESAGGSGRLEHSDLPVCYERTRIREQSLHKLSEKERSGLGDAKYATAPRFGRDGGEMVSELEKPSGRHDSTPWERFDLVPCADGKTRRVEPGVHPLAHGISGRVGLLRGYGNAIVPQVAAEFVRAFLECDYGN